MRYVKDGYGYKAIFDEKTGYTIRSGEKGENPFWKADGPELLDIAITNYCERGCDFCYRSSNKYGQHMDLDLYEKVLKAAKAVNVFQIALGGGNPNQHPQFIDILRMTRECGIVPSYTTNGQGMTAEIYEATRKYGGALAVSWYYPYDDAKKVIENASMYGISVNIHFVIDAENISQARELLKESFLDYVNAIVFLNYKPVGNGNRNVLKKENEISELIEELLQFKRCQIGFDSCMISHLVEKIDAINLCSIDYCEAGRFSAFISETGKMYPCSFMCGAGMKGSCILAEDIGEIWRNSKNFIDIRNDILMPQNLKCTKCEKYSQCHGGCPVFDINCL
jgi:radical SAM protein with 4Fe4S-binding SPASM domain